MKGKHILLVLLAFTTTLLQSQKLGDNYIQEWKKFYPSKALKAGFRPSVFFHENLSEEIISQWIIFNEETLSKLAKANPDIDAIDGRLLRVQAQSEIDIWKILAIHKNDLRLYTQLISRAVPTILEADYLLASEKSTLINKRFLSIEKLCLAAKKNLIKITQSDSEYGVDTLNKALEDLRKNDTTSEIVNNAGNLSKATEAIESLIDFIQTLETSAENNNAILGRAEYDRQLGLYTDSGLTSKQLAKIALEEIETVKGLMATVAKKYIVETYPDKNLPKSDSEFIRLALQDMEKDAPHNGAEYLEFWQDLADDAVDFIEKNNIATLPKNQTLKIQTAPESAGAAARIGWVASAPPFDPNPMTTLNLPSIPETLPKQEQIDFWASFNKPFNRMIVIHELFPGHYMQLKISRETPHPIRLLFPYGIYIEGWATFTEKVLLDSGWEKGKHLTFLAHLRKRLENANRAYTSVQVHCNGWNKAQVMKFSTETSLLAPQFAKSLWGRIMNSPMQLTSYYLGGVQFTKLLKAEKERLGNKFKLELFMDTIMKAGPIPIDEFYSIFETIVPK